MTANNDYAIMKAFLRAHIDIKTITQRVLNHATSYNHTNDECFVFRLLCRSLYANLDFFSEVLLF